MSNVTLEIAGRKYQVASDSGEEAHVEQLGKIIDDRLAGQEGLSAQSEVRSLLYAALILADEVYEAQNGGQLLSAPDPVPNTAPDPQPLEKMADRLEALADQLESAAHNP